jgi:hypothetical protein
MIARNQDSISGFVGRALRHKTSTEFDYETQVSKRTVLF